MNIKLLHHYRLFLWLLALMILVLVAGCGAVKITFADRSEFNKAKGVIPDPLQDTFLLETADRFGLMALFAEVVYRRDFENRSKNSSGCKYLTPGKEQESRHDHGMPPGWTRWAPTVKLEKGASPCFGKSGLYYETYIFTKFDNDTKKNVTTEAVIAFRGTENRLFGELFYDWGSNVAAAFAFEPNQYKLASVHVPVIIKGLQKEFNVNGNKIQIYATGHSLGGGLAQQAGYLSKDIQEVFTFNTSPVTNWSSLMLRGDVDNYYPVIHRVYHGGEVLEGPRFVSTSATNARYGRHDIGLQFGDVNRSLFSGHDMKIIACNFASMISIQGKKHEATHHYSAQFIDQHVLVKGDPPHCVIDTAICRVDKKKEKKEKKCEQARSTLGSHAQQR